MKILEQILDEIKSRAQELSKNHWGDDERHLVGKGIQCMCVQAEEIIRSHMEDDGWISVESPPQKEGFYLACLSERVTLEPDMRIVKAWWSENYNAFSDYGRNVIAWRPLPEPYRQKEG